MSDKTNPPDHPVDPLQPGSVPFSQPPRPKAPDANKPGTPNQKPAEPDDGSENDKGS